MAEPRAPRPWLFALTGTPYGVGGTFTGFVMPYLASRAKIDLEAIGWVLTLLFVPTFLPVLYAPIVDFGPKRKHWLVISAFLGGACLFGAYQMELPDQIGPFLALAF